MSIRQSLTRQGACAIVSSPSGLKAALWIITGHWDRAMWVMLLSSERLNTRWDVFTTAGFTPHAVTCGRF